MDITTKLNAVMALGMIFDNEKTPSIEFNPAWRNHTGYLDYAVEGDQAPVLEPGTIVKFVTPQPNNRRGIILSTMFGNVVVFERFTGGQNGVVVANAPDVLRRCMLVPSGAWSYDEVNEVFGTGGNRCLQARIAYLIKEAAALT